MYFKAIESGIKYNKPPIIASQTKFNDKKYNQKINKIMNQNQNTHHCGNFAQSYDKSKGGWFEILQLETIKHPT